MKNRRAIHRADCKRSEWAWWRWGRARSSLPDCRSNVSPTAATWTGCTKERFFTLLMDVEVFDTLWEAKVLAERWRRVNLISAPIRCHTSEIHL